MQAFRTLTGIMAPLPMINVDTDMIIPKQFLKTVKRTGLGTYLFEELRRNPDTGEEVPEFVLNREPYRNAQLLVAGKNFGCGSSREHAPWALLDFGIRCVIAPSFADIFHANCFKNGMLPVRLPQDQISELFEWVGANSGAQLTVDLESQTLSGDSLEYPFEVDPFRRDCLLKGLNDIDLTLKYEEQIREYESKFA